MIGIPASPYQAWPTYDNPATPASCRHQVRSPTKDPNGGQVLYIRLAYWNNQFEGFFIVGPAIKAYTVFAPEGPFPDQHYYYYQVLKTGTGMVSNPYKYKEYWVWDGIQVRASDGFIFRMANTSGAFRTNMAHHQPRLGGDPRAAATGPGNLVSIKWFLDYFTTSLCPIDHNRLHATFVGNCRNLRSNAQSDVVMFSSVQPQGVNPHRDTYL